MTAPTSRVKKVVFSVILVLVVMIAVEGGTRALMAVMKRDIRWLAFGFDNYQRMLSFDLDFFPGYKKAALNPDGSNPLNVNARGFRGPMFQTAKPASVFRIASVGGSTTFGVGVPWDVAYPALLERQLNEKFGKRCVEVINAGVPSQTTAEIGRLVEREVVTWKPDLLTVYSLYNHLFFDRLQFKSDSPVVGKTLEFIYDNVAPVSVFVGEAVERLAFLGPLAYGNKVESYRAALDSIITQAKTHGIRVVLAIELIQKDAIPGSDEHSVRRVDSWATLDQYRRFVDVVNDLARQHGLDVVDFSTLSQDYREHGDSLLMDSAHLTPKGNELLATRIREKIEGLPELVRTCGG